MIIRKCKTLLNYIRALGNLHILKEIEYIFYMQYSLRLKQEIKARDTKRLEPFGYKVYSQNEEDGMIEEIFHRIGIKNRFFVEFGVQDGLECNSHFLLFQGWEGVFIEGDEKSVKKIRENFAPVLKSDKLTLIHHFITAENINDLISSTKALQIGEIDLLSIDIDGNDYHIFKAINAINPRVVVIEFNAKFPPPTQYIMPYNPSHVWNLDDMHGASLESLSHLATQKGYNLVGTDIKGVNAFFVRKDLCGDLFPSDDSAKNLYNAPFWVSTPTGHNAKRFLPNAALSD